MRTARDPSKNRVVALLMTDVEGSVRRWEAFPERMGAMIAVHDDVLRKEIDRRGGSVFKSAGDGLFAVFDSPSTAIESAVAGQRAIAATDFSAVDGLTVRMAVYAGYVEAVDGDYFGPAVNRCSRLLSLAFGEQIVVGAAAADMARGFMSPDIELHDLGRHFLRDVPFAERVYQATAEGLRDAFPPLKSGRAAAHNLPPQLTTFVERPSCSSVIRERLENHRIVTLVGPGGIGKTRMAVETAYAIVEAGLGGRLLDEIRYIELASLSDPVLVAETVCAAIGIDIPPRGSAATTAVTYLKNKRALVIFDNCEHIIDACCEVIVHIVGQCPAISILATSRERLTIPGEASYTIPGLTAPATTPGMGADWALKHEAVRLFAERAAMIEGFVVSDANADAVCSICRQLDGIPMAIELTVPHLRMMRIEDLDARLRTHLLTFKGGRTPSARHHTLLALFDWSYRLLSDDERALFIRLSVFAGSWSLDAAAEIAADVLAGVDDVLEVMTSLVDKSLVSVGPSGVESRYDFLQPVRQYAVRKLREAGEQAPDRRLAAYVLRTFRSADRTWSTTATAYWTTSYRPELENLRAALDWAFSEGGDIGLAAELTGYAVRLWDELSLFEEQRRYRAMASDRAPNDTAPAVLARLWMARVSNTQHGDRTNFERAIRAAELFTEAGHQLEAGEALAKAGAALLTPETVDEAVPYLDKALVALKPLGPTKPLAACLRSKSVAAYLSGDFAAAKSFLAGSEQVARDVGDDLGFAAVQIAAAELAFAAQDPLGAIAVTQAMLAEGTCNLRQRILGSGNLAAYALALNRIDDAAAAALDSLRDAKSLNWPAAITRAVEHVALVLALRGRLELAANLLGFADAFYGGKTASREQTELATSERLRGLLIERLPPDRLSEATTAGAAWDHDRAARAATSIA